MSAVLAGTAFARRANFLRWLRQAHAWLGLWGAVMGTFFGVTGIVQNHRAILPIPLKAVEVSAVQIALDAAPESPAALAGMLARELGFESKAPRIKVEKSKTVVWNGRPVTQPELWQFWFDSPQRYARAEYLVGNRFVKVERYDPNLFATLARLHMATGVNAAWVVLADAVAGGIILLSMSGILLWTRLRGLRVTAAAVALASLALGLLFAWMAR